MSTRHSTILLVVGGIIPTDDEEYLRDIGVDTIFGPGVSLD
jgi:methylmalonyl-CoA mutase cobalamin-binding domain/chain